MNRLLTFLFLLSFSTLTLAAGAGYDASVGDAARNVNEVLKGISGILVAIIYIAGAAVLCSAAMKYRIHRQNPQQVPISTVITELILGIVLLCLPTVTQYANENLFTEGDPIKAPGTGSQAISQPSKSGQRTTAPVGSSSRR